MWSLKGSFVASVHWRPASAELLGDLVFRALQSIFSLPNTLPIGGVTRALHLGACFWWQDVERECFHLPFLYFCVLGVPMHVKYLGTSSIPVFLRTVLKRGTVDRLGMGISLGSSGVLFV